MTNFVTSGGIKFDIRKRRPLPCGEPFPQVLSNEAEPPPAGLVREHRGKHAMQCPVDRARSRATMPAGTSGILNARSLKTAHRRLAELLKPGLSVLDVGCGTGAITRGIAEAVGPHGRVLGIDTNARLIEEARSLHGEVAALRFDVCDVHHLPFHGTFDITTAARVLQWLSDPLDALSMMAAATKPRGRVVVLDYNHEKIAWMPDPPNSMRTFYATFLRWRGDAGMDNAIGDHLAEMFAHVGMVDIAVTTRHEWTQRGDPDFHTRIGIWADVAASRGHQMTADGVITERERAAAEADSREWIRDRAESQSMYLIATEGTTRRP
jgi:SAM-dependent methyltransferase